MNALGHCMRKALSLVWVFGGFLRWLLALGLFWGGRAARASARAWRQTAPRRTGENASDRTPVR